MDLVSDKTPAKAKYRKELMLGNMNNVQREYKSNSFSLLMKEKKYALEVYNYLNNSHYTNEDDIQIVEIDGGIKLSVRNDATFIVDGYVNLYEHQSTPNPNMPLRLLIYVAAFYKEYTKGKDLYGPTLIQIPTPKLVVFYNGVNAQPERAIMKLSDAYMQPMDDPMLELKCQFYNINPGSNEELKDCCSSIAGYTQYVEKVREYAGTMVLEDAIRKAVEECIEEGILAEFFKEKKEMIISADAIDCTYERREQFWKRDIEKAKQEAEEAKQEAKDARIKEIVSSVKEGDYSRERGAQKLGISISDFEKIMSDPRYS